ELRMSRIYAGSIALCVLFPPYCASEAMADEQALRNYLSGRHVLISRRDGEAVYGTYYFFYTHYCSSGRYVIYASSVKQSVLGGENRQRWEVRGTWKVVTQKGQEGVFYQDTDGGTDFLPLRMRPDGSVFVRDGINFAPQGRAEC
ncbi:MAG: hypothetical protein ACRET7_14290, partial [Burkholderiales bacterium]